jgi:hypothetical protein
MYNFQSKNSDPTIHPIKLRGINKQTKTTLTSITNSTACERKKFRQNQIAKNRVQYISSVADQDGHDMKGFLKSIVLKGYYVIDNMEGYIEQHKNELNHMMSSIEREKKKQYLIK